MSAANKPAPAPKGEYVYGYAIACEGDFYDGGDDFTNLEDARIYSETELTDALKAAAKETDRDSEDLERVAIVIREL